MKQDHRVIEKVLGAIEDAAERVRRGEEVPVQLLGEALEFSQVFVDRCHHGKEEVCLFPCLERKGVPNEGGPIGVMLREHQIGREMAGAIGAALKEDLGKPEARARVAALCTDYVEHLRQHIFKEENVLFGMGDSLMGRDDHESSVECYERTEEERVGFEKHEEMERLAEKLGSARGA